MKKIYTFVLLVTHIAYTACMEIELKKIQPKTESLLQPGVKYPSPKASYPTSNAIPIIDITMPQQLSQMQPHIITNNPLPQHNQPIILAPSTTSTISTTDCVQEQKIILYPLKPVPNQQKIKQLYSIRSFISTITLKQLIEVIIFMNKTKTKHHIDESMMAQYSYDKWLKNKNKYSSEQMVLTFLYLKNYSQQISSCTENIPKYKNITKKNKNIGNKLADSLGLISDKNTSTSNGAYDRDFTAHNYPAFHTLRTNIVSMIKSRTENIRNFIDYIYSNHTELENKYQKLSYDNLKNTFYHIAGHITSEEKAWGITDLCNVIHIIDVGKTLNPPKQEYDFAGETKNKKISMLCHLIKTYNYQHKTKKTPTSVQRKVYESGIPIYKFALPDSFNSELLDDKIYAFKEFNQLVDKFSILRSACDEDVEECIKQIDFSQNK